MSRFVSIGALLGIIVFGCSSETSLQEIRNLRSPGKNIICFGDSLTEGVGASRGEDYPAVLARNLRAPVLNAGERGNTTAMALARLERDVLGHDPRLVIVLLGGNDFLRQVPIGETRKNLEEIVRRIQERGAMVAVVGLKLGLFTDSYGPVYEEIARRYKALHIPEVLKGILSDPQLKSDSIHPNGSGYRLVAERILNRVQPLLEEAERSRGAGA